jgi:hypothetical protein
MIFDESNRLADEMADEYARSLRLAIAKAGSIATGELQKSPRVWRTTLGSRLLFKRFVTASRHWIFVDRGRRKGAPMPVHVIGQNAKGKPIFAPFPTLVRWFLLMNIPSRAWWPIMRRIKERGIRAKNIQSIALRNAQVRWRSILQFRAKRIAERLLRANNRSRAA